jgi:hypothetical protein
MAHDIPLVDMAKVQKEDAVALPGLTELLEGPKERPAPQSEPRPSIPDEDLLGPLPQPGEAPRPEAVKVRAKAGTAPTGQGKKPLPKKKGKMTRILGYIKGKLWFLFPPDPVDQKRRNLRLLGLTKYLFVPIIVVTLTAILVIYLWWYLWSYSDTMALYSRIVPTLVFLIPLGLGVFVGIYLPLNIFFLNKLEAKMNRDLTDKLKAKLPEGPKAPVKVRAPPKKEELPEAPLPQPTVHS